MTHTRTLAGSTFEDREAAMLARRVIWLSISLWLFEWLIWEFVRVYTGGEFSVSVTVWRLFWVITGLGAGTLVWKVCWPYREHSFLVLSSLAVGLVLAIGIVHAGLNRFVYFFAAGEWPASGELAANIYAYVRYWSHFYVAWVAIVLALVYSDRVKREQVVRTNAQSAAQAAQVDALRYQVNPRLLFNTFDAITQKVRDGRFKAAEKMIRQISTLLRHNLNPSAHDIVPLREEIALLEESIELEQARHAGNVVFRSNAYDDQFAGDALFPSFVLRPLLERAFGDELLENGPDHAAEPITVDVTAYRSGDTLVVTLEKGGAEKPKFTIDLQQDRQLAYISGRLAACYGSRFSFKHEATTSGDLFAQIEVPFAKSGR